MGASKIPKRFPFGTEIELTDDVRLLVSHCNDCTGCYFLNDVGMCTRTKEQFKIVSMCAPHKSDNSDSVIFKQII